MKDFNIQCNCIWHPMVMNRTTTNNHENTVISHILL